MIGEMISMFLNWNLILKFIWVFIVNLKHLISKWRQHSDNGDKKLILKVIFTKTNGIIRHKIIRSSKFSQLVRFVELAFKIGITPIFILTLCTIFWKCNIYLSMNIVLGSISFKNIKWKNMDFECKSFL